MNRKLSTRFYRVRQWLGWVCFGGIIFVALSMLQSRRLDRRLDGVLEAFTQAEREAVLPPLGEPPSSDYLRILRRWEALGPRGRERTIVFSTRPLPKSRWLPQAPRWLYEPLNRVTGGGRRWDRVWRRRMGSIGLMSVADLDRASVRRLVAAHIENPDKDMRLHLAFGLSNWEAPEATDGLRRLSEDGSPRIRLIARLALWRQQPEQTDLAEEVEDGLGAISDWEAVAHYSYLGRIAPVLSPFSEPLLGLIEGEPWGMKRLSMLKIYWRLTDDEDAVRGQLRALARWARVESEADTQPARDSCGAVVNAAVFSWLSDDRFNQELEELLSIVYQATRIHRSLRLNGQGMLEGLREVYGIGPPSNLSSRATKSPSRGGADPEHQGSLLD